MADTWTLDKNVTELSQRVKDLENLSHEPIFTSALVKNILDRLDVLEKKCKCGKPKKKVVKN